MSQTRFLRFLIGLLLITGIGLGLGSDVGGQSNPTWKNDAQGRPAPPCMTLDTVTGISTPCSASNPIPTSGGGTGLGTTSGTSVSGFGKQWYAATMTGTSADGNRMVSQFLSDQNVAIWRRSIGGGNVMQAAISTDGGVTAPAFISTGFGIVDNLGFAFTVPSNPPRFLIATQPSPATALVLNSLSVNGGWSNSTSVGVKIPFTGGIETLASKPDGSRVLYANADAVGNNFEVCISTNQGQAFSICNLTAVGGVVTGVNLGYAGGTTWVLSDNSGRIWRSVDDGLSFTLIVTLAGANPNHLICQTASTPATTCFVNGVSTIFRSTDAGLTWVATGTSFGGVITGNLCDYGGGNIGLVTANSPPIGLGAINNNAASSNDSGLSWYFGKIFGSAWDGAGVVGGGGFSCRNGRGFHTYSTSGGVPQIFAIFNPLTQPGGTLQSSAGGYNVSAPIQAGVILNAAPTTSAANTAAVITLTNTTGSRICIRSLTLFSSAAGIATLTVTDGATVVRNFGTLVTGTSAALTTFEGAPLLCGQTSNNVVVNIGAAGAGVTTTTSAIADRYPN